LLRNCHGFKAVREGFIHLIWSESLTGSTVNHCAFFPKIFWASEQQNYMSVSKSQGGAKVVQTILVVNELVKTADFTLQKQNDVLITAKFGGQEHTTR